LGMARIIATAEGVTDTVQFAVTAIPVATVTISPLQASLREGSTIQLRATVQDSAGTTVTDRPLEWVSSDLSKATVSSTGLVSARAPGNVFISATTEGRSGQHALTVTAIPVDTIVVDTATTLLVGQTSAVAITLRDATGSPLTFRNLLVTSSNPGVAIGAANAQATQVTISGIAAGTARLTIQALDDANRPQGKASSLTVTVNRPPLPPGSRER